MSKQLCRKTVEVCKSRSKSTVGALSIKMSNQLLPNFQFLKNENEIIDPEFQIVNFAFNKHEISVSHDFKFS